MLEAIVSQSLPQSQPAGQGLHRLTIGVFPIRAHKHLFVSALTLSFTFPCHYRQVRQRQATERSYARHNGGSQRRHL